MKTSIMSQRTHFGIATCRFHLLAKKANNLQPHTSDECEIGSYFDKSLLNVNECPLNWWIANTIEYPKLFQLAWNQLLPEAFIINACSPRQVSCMNLSLKVQK